MVFSFPVAPQFSSVYLNLQNRNVLQLGTLNKIEIKCETKYFKITPCFGLDHTHCCTSQPELFFCSHVKDMIIAVKKNSKKNIS